MTVYASKHFSNIINVPQKKNYNMTHLLKYWYLLAFINLLLIFSFLGLAIS